MLWEVSVLNKIYKTNTFSRIKPRALKGKHLYVISNDLKFSQIVLDMSKDDLLLTKNEDELL
jgi:hypothetical protein